MDSTNLILHTGAALIKADHLSEIIKRVKTSSVLGLLSTKKKEKKDLAEVCRRKEGERALLF